MKIVSKTPEEHHNYGQHSYLSEFVWLVGATVLGLLGLYTVSGWLVSYVVQYVPQDTEHRLFSDLGRSMIGTHNQALDAEAQRLLDRLLLVAPEIELPMRAFVVEKDEPNAMAIPGGSIVITTALLREAKSENEIMMVLAHELGHFRLRHHLRGFGRGIIMLATYIVIGGDPAVESIVTPSSQLISLSFSRTDEEAADSYALDVLNRVYGHVGGATEFFRRASRFELSLPGAKYMSTHPLSGDRVRSVKALIAERGYRELSLVSKPGVFAMPLGSGT